MQYKARHAWPLLSMKVSLKNFFRGEKPFKILLNKTDRISTIDKQPPMCDDFA